MIFVNHIAKSKAAKDYYAQHIAPGDYYGKDSAEMKGIWHGEGAKMLGLQGEVKQADFFLLCDNLKPDGTQLTQRTRDDRRVLTDFTFDAPKSVSLALEMGGHDGMGDMQILTAMQEATRETMAEIEKDVKTRVRREGADYDRPTGNLIWAEHVHRTTRPVEGVPDPQLHIHATVVNATYDRVEEKWKAVQLGDVIRDKGYYQAAFHSRLASKIKDLGYSIEKDGKSFKLAGIEKSTAEKFSRRTAIIEAEAERLGITNAKEKGELGRRTREGKSKDRVSMTDLQKKWDKRLTPEERLAIRTAAAGWEAGDAAITPEQAKEYALEHSFEKASAVSEKRLKAEALAYAVGSIKPEDVADIAQHPEAIPATRDGQLFVTTKTVLKNEVAFLQFAKDGQRKQKPFLISSGDVLAKASQPSDESAEKRFDRVLTESLDGLSEEQKKAALHVLNSRDTVTGVIGKAGVGKTRMLRSTSDVIEGESGKRVFAFAPSAQARDVLRKDGFQNAQTLAMLIKSQKLQEEAAGQVLLVDEAGMISSRDMRRLMDVAKKHKNRVILAGDYSQHASVEAGDAFRLLEKEAGIRFAKLTQNRRQIEPGYKGAVEAISQGSGKAAQKGFDALDKMGCVIEANADERHDLLVRDYLKAREEGASALIIAPTHAEGDLLTDELRTELKARGAIAEERDFIARKSTGWSDAEKRDARNYEKGQIVEFHQNIKGGFKRGEKTVVVESGPESAVVLKQDGTQCPLPLDKAERFEVYRPHEIAIAKGDRLRITKNGEAKVEGQAKGTRVNNGDIFTVEGFTKEGDIRLEKGRLLPKDWGHMQLGYVDTSYSSQGKTVDRVFIATGAESIAATNQQQWYVSVSRGREAAKVYVDSKKDLREAIARTSTRLSAVELTHTKIGESWRSRLSESLERNRIGRFFKQRAASIADLWRDRGRGREMHG